MGSEFIAGSTVRLKSGGPVMTIESVIQLSESGYSGTAAKCVWFDDTTVIRGTFLFPVIESA